MPCLTYQVSDDKDNEIIHGQLNSITHGILKSFTSEMLKDNRSIRSPFANWHYISSYCYAAIKNELTSNFFIS